MKHHRQLTYEDRIKIEALFRAGHTKREIAQQLGVHVSTVYREIKRGLYRRLDGPTWIYYDEYSADIAERDRAYKATAKGQPLKIGKDHNLVTYIETMIIEHKQSPDAVIGRIRSQGLYFDTTICTRTLYRYIDDGLFLNLTNKHLPMRGERKRNYKRVRIRQRKVMCRSIEERPHAAHEREFGHWEMDTVVSGQGGKAALLVLTERRTRYELILKLQEKTQLEVKRQLDRLERKHGRKFREIFKTITCDNGTEFLNTGYIENSILQNSKRTAVYYCHPYSAFERGSNENQNKMIRRFIPKGTNIAAYTDKHISEMQAFINKYPRRILGYMTSLEQYNKCISCT